MNNAALGKLIWVLIYGGLLAVALGLVMQKTDGSLGWPIAMAGAVVTLVGAVLVFVRARRSDTP
jgi:membrane protease YdiL (CAAX protease family)